MSDNQNIPIKRPSVTVPDFISQAATSQKTETKYPTETIKLPTAGFFYDISHSLSSGEVEIKQMTAKEEDLLANQNLIKSGKVLDKLIESLLVDKSINVDGILVSDKNAILVGIRRLAYGDDYHVSVTCPTCGGQNKIKIDLSKLENKPFNFDGLKKGQNAFNTTLPSGLKITYKLLNQTDENAIDGEINSLKKLSKESSSEITTRLKHIIISINGNDDAIFIRKFIKNSG